jgi:hypothetical protein
MRWPDKTTRVYYEPPLARGQGRSWRMTLMDNDGR